MSLKPTSFLDDIETLSAFASLGLACVCLVVTQTYLHCLEGTLLPRNVVIDHTIQETYCEDITYWKNLSDFAESGPTERDCKESRDKCNDIEMSIVNKQITPESEEGKPFIPK